MLEIKFKGWVSFAGFVGFGIGLEVFVWFLSNGFSLSYSHPNHAYQNSLSGTFAVLHNSWHGRLFFPFAWMTYFSSQNIFCDSL